MQMLKTHTPLSRPYAGSEPIQNIHMMENHDSAYDIWKAMGVQNRTLVHFDGHLDFNWIAERSPQELLSAGSSEKLDRLLNLVTQWNLDGKPLRDLVNIGNFIYAAIKEGMVREFWWVIPDGFWTTPGKRRALQEGLEAMIGRRPREAGTVHVSETSMTLSVLGCPLTVCTIEHLPQFTKPVLLDIDVDYLVTHGFGEEPPYFEPEPRGPWLSPSEWIERLRKIRIPTDLVTIVYSVEGGFTPLRYKYFGDLLASALANPHDPISDLPPCDSAAEAYEAVLETMHQGKWSEARESWGQTVGRDPSYRGVYAFPGCREERAGRNSSAAAVYEQVLEIDPDWHVPHLGMGRILWRSHRWDEAEEAFEKACQLAAGPTSATYWLGRSVFRRGDWKKAEQMWKKTVEEQPKDPLAWYALARLAHRRRDSKSVMEYAKRCLSLKWDSPMISVHWLMGWAAWRLGQRRLAQNEFRLWLKWLILSIQYHFLTRMKGFRMRHFRQKGVYANPGFEPEESPSMV